MTEDDATTDVKTLLAQAAHRLAGVSGDPTEARITAQAWLAQVLGVDRAWLLAYPEADIEPDMRATFEAGLQRLLAGEPLAYLTGFRAFFGRRFTVTPDVLVPRPETEHLIEAALEWAAGRPAARILDIGTGSGVIAVTLALELPQARLWATDLLPTALAVAQHNAARFGVGDRIHWATGDLFAGLPGGFDLICCNPPYIPTDDLATLAVSRFEPITALDGGADGLGVVRRLLVEASPRLNPDGLLLVEIGAGQGERVLAAARRTLDANCHIRYDLAGHDRLLYAHRRPTPETN